jgi:zinc transport system substrate-binding protein
MIVMTTRRLLAALTGPALAVGALAGCGSTPSPSGDERVQVAAAFYALEYAAHRIGGDRVEVTGLTKPGVEPHDVELSAKRVGAVALADLVVHFRGFQPAVDEAVDHQAEGAVLDVRDAARPLSGEPHDHEGETAQEHQAHADEPHADETVDPHFWLDPHRYADVARAMSAELQRVDPAHAAGYRARTEAFTADLDALDHALEEGLAGCRSRELVTSHAAFGYLAQAYDLHQEGITGLSPEAEPSPAALARVAHFVRDKGVRTIYAETMVSRDVADTLARETGAQVQVLDPIEGLTEESAGDDYLEVMRANLATLRDGQDCR